MKRSNSERNLSGLAALLLLAVSAVAILSVLLHGANAYRRLTQRNQNNYDSRTCIQYIATKLRQAPNPTGVSVAPFGSKEALFIHETHGDTRFLTRIYCYDGWLMELFTAAYGEFDPQDGERILPLADLELTADGGFITVTAHHNSGDTQTITISIRGYREEQT